LSALTPRAKGDNNEMTDAGALDLTYDHFGNTVSIVGQETMTYDLEGHMTEWKPNGALVEDTHEYDGNGRRMRSKLDNAANWTHFIHDELTENLICEFTLISGTFTIKALNTYGLGLISSNREGTIRYFHFDGLGSTAHLTDTSQNITDSYTYNAFGVPYTPSGSSTNPYRYVGQWGYYDDGAMGSSSGMLLLGVRYYWPKYGRFTTWDSQRNAELYAYTNLPTVRVDPEGLAPRCQIPIPGFGNRWPYLGPTWPLINRTVGQLGRIAKCIACARRIAAEMLDLSIANPDYLDVFSDNAIRHCVWACKVEKLCDCGNLINVKEVQDIIEFWELGWPLVAIVDTRADLYNNAIGRLFAKTPRCVDSCRWARTVGILA
jgi:RHS repeat-associated protein